MTKLLIRVTRETINQAAYCGTNINDEDVDIGQNCAIALAVRDIFPRAYVGPHTIYPFGEVFNEHPDNISLPVDAILFIDKFDAYTPELRMNMQPMEFEVEIPDTVINQLDISEITQQLLNHPTLKLQEV